MALPKIGHESETEAERERRRIQRETNQAAIDLLSSWLEDEDEENRREQHETLEYLIRAIDEDRLSYRKRFS